MRQIGLIKVRTFPLPALADRASRAEASRKLGTGDASVAEHYELRHLYERLGGLVSDAMLAGAVRESFDIGVGHVALLIVDRRVVQYRLDGAYWLPLFQFDCLRPRACAIVEQKVAELSCAFTDVKIARWFGQANDWLSGMAPAELFRVRLSDVLEAARAGRYVASGCC